MSAQGTADPNTMGLGGSNNYFSTINADGSLALDGVTSNIILPAVAASPITVYFPVNTHVSTVDVQLFGQEVTTPDRVIVLETPMPLASMRAFLHYCQDPANRDNVIVSTIQGGEEDATAGLSTCIHNQVLLDSSSYANWWKQPGASQVADASNYSTFTDVPKFLLAQICYDVLGHPLAQAGLANDEEILAELNASGVADLVVADMKAKSALASAMSNGTAVGGNLRVIYQQMFAQAPSRFQQADTGSNQSGVLSSEPPALPLELPFSNGDKVRFELTLDSYNVFNYMTASVGNAGSNGSNADVFSGTNFMYSNANASNINYTNYGANTYTVEVTLAVPVPE